MSHGVLPGRLADGTRLTLAPVARALQRAGIGPNAVTVWGALVMIGGSALLALERPLGALVVLLVGALADTVDGQLARANGGGTPFGAFLDSTLDRVSDAALFCGAAAVGARLADPVLFWSALVGLVASFLVSYVRAKAESIGIRATVGVAPREARLTILLLGLAAWALVGTLQLFVAAVVAVAALSLLTLFQRVAHVARALDASDQNSQGR